MTSGLLSDRTLSSARSCWDAAVFALYGLLVWILPLADLPGATCSRSSRFSRCRWRDCPRRRWHSRGTGIDEKDEQETKVIGAVADSHRSAVLLVAFPRRSLSVFGIETTASWSPRARSGSTCSTSRRSYDRTKPTPLVISMHGAGGWPVQQMDLSGWNGWPTRRGSSSSIRPDVEAAGRGSGAVIADPVCEGRPIHLRADRQTGDASTTSIPARIYANGLSNGGGMALRAFLHAVRPDRRGRDGREPRRRCRGAGARIDEPVPMIAFHGTADRHGAVQRRHVVGRPDPSRRSARGRANWARRNHCATEAGRVRGRAPTSRAANTRVVRTTRPSCSTRIQGRRAHLARRRAAAGVVRRTDEPQHRRHGEMWAFFCASASQKVTDPYQPSSERENSKVAEHSNPRLAAVPPHLWDSSLTLGMTGWSP